MNSAWLREAPKHRETGPKRPLTQEIGRKRSPFGDSGPGIYGAPGDGDGAVLVSRQHRIEGNYVLMKSRIVAALVFATSIATAQARTEWQGTGKIKDLNQVCLDVGWRKGSDVNLRYRPSGMSDNGKLSGFSVFYPYHAYGVTAKGRFTGALRKVRALGIAAGGYGPDKGTRFRFVSIKPSNYDETTNTLSVTAEFINYGGDKGCTMRLKGKLKKQ